MKSRSGRLKNFCQICRKQCKDQNGFHCHLNSASHQRRVRQYVTNPNEHIQKYSKQLQFKFLQMLKVKYPGEPKNINDLWDQYADQKYHIEFKQTQWKNLQQFVQFLKQNKNLSVVGAFPSIKVTYLINKTSQFLTEQKKKKVETTRQKQKQNQQNVLKNKIEKLKQIQQYNFNRVQEQMKKKHEQIQQFDPNQRLFIRLDGIGQAPKRNSMFGMQDLQKQIKDDSQNKFIKKTKNAQMLLEKINALQQKKQIKKIQQQKKEEEQFEWIMKDIFVKIKPHNISQAFHGKKAKIIQISEPYVAKIKIGTATLQIDQTYLETVIPKINHKVKLLYGDKRGLQGILQKAYIEEGYGIVNVNDKLFQISFDNLSKIQ